MRFVIALLALASSCVALSQPAGFSQTSYITSLNTPTCMAFAPNGKLYVGEKSGAIKVFSGNSLVGTFTTIPCRSDSERGVLGLAFDPNFNSNRFVYVYYTTNVSNPKNRVSRFTELADQALPGSETVIVDNIPSDAGNHNAGCLRFGIDGMLYIATGDGGSTPSNSQSLANLAGKILRVTPDGTIPVDNPFFNQSGKRGEIYCYGLRNPFRFAFRPATLVPFIADVGQNTWEEINVGASGANFGWPTYEGISSTSGFADPIYQYNHNGSGASITGGCFAGEGWPTTYSNRFLYGDFVLSQVNWIEVNNANAAIDSGSFSNLPSPVDFAQGPDGAVYVASINGTIYRLAYKPLVAGITGSNVYGGNSGSGSVSLTLEAPVGGQTVAMTSSNPSVLTLQSSITIPAGSLTGSFGFDTVGVLATSTSVVSASCNGSTRTKTFYVLPAKLIAFSTDPVAVVGGNSTPGTVTLIGKAPVGGRTVSLSSSNPSVAQVPASVQIPAGQSTAQFVVTTSPATQDNNVSITASLGSTSLPRTVAVLVQLHRIASITMNPNPVVSGSGTTGRISITRPAPAEGLVINLVDNSSVVTTPSTVTIPPGATVTTFPISTTAVNQPYTVNVQGKYGISVKNSDLFLEPCVIENVATYPPTVPGGISANAQVLLRNVAPTGGAVIDLVDSSPWATMPSTVTVTAGERSVNFVVDTLPITQNVIVTITASYLGASRATVMTITNLAALESVSLTPSTFKGGTSANGSVALTKFAPPGGVTVSLSDTLSVLSTPTSVRVGSGAKLQSFVATSTPVTSTAVGTLIASANGVTRTITVTLTP